jgi:hypothetical protein
MISTNVFIIFSVQEASLMLRDVKLAVYKREDFKRDAEPQFGAAVIKRDAEPQSFS